MWKLNSAERLSRWRAFRKSLDTVSLETAAEQVSDFWVKCPYVGYYLDHDQPNTDRKSTRLNSSHVKRSRMPSSA